MTIFEVIKDALWDKFEDLRDRELIEEYEAGNRAGKIQFESVESLVAKIEQKPPAYGTRTERPAPGRKGRPRKKF